MTNNGLKNITVIYDLTSTDLWEDKVLDFDIATIVDAMHLYYLAEELSKFGFKVMTADMFLKQGNYDGINLMITENETQHTSSLINHGCIPSVCYCGESPLVIPGFYNQLKSKVGRFRHGFVFKGAHKAIVSDNHVNHIFYWTNIKNRIVEEIPWEQRKFLTLINSNKYSSYPSGIKKAADIKPWIKVVLRYFRNWKAFHTFPGKIRDLYNIRLQAILFFCHNKNFDLYGQGWNSNILGVSRTEQKQIRDSYRGSFPRGNENKHSILKNYKFALCFENTVFSGYVTEKIFDCILCGTIPVYFGASDIAEFIPPQVYIDFRDFSSFAELESYLISISDDVSKQYRDAAKAFVNSPQYEKYYLTGWNRSIIESLQETIKHRY